MVRSSNCYDKPTIFRGNFLGGTSKFKTVVTIIFSLGRGYSTGSLEEHELYLVRHIKIYNSGYSTEIVNEQCNTGDPLETSGGLYRGPPSMLIYVKYNKMLCM